ncbi:MAG: hypothetical protein IJN31_01285, partial [Peptococcaceae bacterium]|nr:hypothetical protein [Peptococcaceae bacterium]
MKKRLLAFVCMVVVALGIFAVVATNAKATGDDVTYKVGYAKVDITPWENPSDPDSIDLIPINTAGYGSSYYADKLIDSNGDGKTDRKDGIFATCTVLTEFIDGNEGTTLVFISMDALNGYGPFIKDIRKAVVPALVTSNSKVNIADSQIFVSGSHCHTAPNFRNLSTSEDEAEAAYYNRVVNEIKDNVVEAYEKKADATISRSTIDVAQYYGYDMNYIRHYENTNYSGDYYGSNFGLELPSGSDWANQHIASADSTMEMVKFTVAGQDPIMLVNWRAHPDNVGARNNYLSPDYVGALRYRMENNVALTGDNTKENYRVSFIQGASGNINAMSLKTASKNQWFNVDTKNPKVQFTDTKGTGNIAVPFVRYGYLLAGAALYADETQQWTPVYGEIRSLRTQYTYATNSYTDAEIAAANAAKNLDGDDFPYHYSYQGKRVTIDTSAHRDKILQYGKGGTPHLTELNTILIGDSLSFVTAPGELFDRYDSAGSVTADSSTTGWGSLNRYGEPIVMGYTNGDMGYFPNTASYDYNIDNSDRAGIGSYEAQTSNFAKGTGEELISAYKNMLDWTKGMTTECEHCGETVTFEPIAQGTFGTSWGEKPPAGHYYLAENVTSNSLIVSPNTEICLHLNGNSLKKLASGSDAGELLYIGTSTGASGAVLNVMDYPENLGIIQSKNRPMTVYGTLNLYGGTIQTSATAALSNGETVYITSGGIVNQRGGIIRGGMTNGGGAAVNVYTGATAKSQFN